MRPVWRHLLLQALFAAALYFHITFPVLADEGHDHGNEAAGEQGTASPRFEAHSDLFELVGIAENGQLTIYLDRYATNEPVVDAKLEFESGEAKGVAAPQADGTYIIKLDALSKPGHVPFSFTVTSGTDTDLLAGELDIADSHAHEEESATPWQRWGVLAAAGLAALALLTVVAIAMRKRTARSARKDVQ
ncbi:hypothetical protein JI739_19485 [Ramlibacter sp. AW1]|uniref:Uncharacterized protein n=1 Tax=Ramlibacter aurantiacus TaxID=2801330 RepID=A0A936ZS94_9BURK|nr:hypothetical protein [Ramlibacter aurantiacus]MBL0422538.1 hypothetical protein [Ramlibacter aurantiacus]